MPKMLRGVIKSPTVRRRLLLISGLVFVLVAALSWWTVMEEGATTARVLAAVASSVAAVLQLAFPTRRRLFRASEGRSQQGSLPES